jgi:hypothetical protein
MPNYTRYDYVAARGVAIGPKGEEVALQATPAEINALHGQGCEAADFAKLAGITKDVYHLNNAVQYKTARYTLAQVNAGQLLVDPGEDGQWCVLDMKLRAIGGAFAACTSIDITEETSGDIVFSAPVAALLQDAWVTISTANVVSTKLGQWGTVGKKLSLAVVGDAATTATHLDVVFTYGH